MSRIVPTASAGRTERAPSANPLRCVIACVAAGLNVASEKKRGGNSLTRRRKKEKPLIREMSFSLRTSCFFAEILPFER
jgi:hypothetical protein